MGVFWVGCAYDCGRMCVCVFVRVLVTVSVRMRICEIGRMFLSFTVGAPLCPAFVRVCMRGCAVSCV